MSDEHGNEGLGEDEEDLGDLLEQSELSGKGFNERERIRTEPTQKPRQLSETKKTHRKPRSPKASIDLKGPPQASSKGLNRDKMTGTKPIQKPQQLSKTEEIHKTPPSPKASVDLKVPPRESLDGVLVLKTPKAIQSPGTKDSLTKVLGIDS